MRKQDRAERWLAFGLGFSLLLGAIETRASELRLLSYNIHHGEGLDRQTNLTRIAQFIRELHPDVVALQEVDQGCQRTGSILQAEELARLTGLKFSFAKFMDYQGGAYGMALLTRLPVLAERRIELPAGREPRASAVMTVQTSDGPVTLANIHFFQSATQRLAQAQSLAQALAEAPRPLIWIGDFNSHRGDPVLTWLQRDFAIPVKLGETNTFPANQPREEIDYVMFQPKDAFTVKEHRVLDERAMSDHRPLFAVLEFAAKASGERAETAHFDAAVAGQVPAGWTASIVGEGSPRWTVERDSSAPSPAHVLKQSAEAPKPSYPLCLRQGSPLKDGFVEAKFKAVSGKIDQAAGVVWRAKDARNYYVCRANAIEDNVVLYKVEDGKRQALDIVGRSGGYGVNTRVTPREWHTLRVEFTGPRFKVSLDGKPLFEVEDRTFPDAGLTGVWTKADSVTLFDDFCSGGR